MPISRKMSSTVRMKKFSSLELERLVELVEKYQHVINATCISATRDAFGRRRHGVTSTQKNNVWEMIASQMEGLGPVIRTPIQIKRKKDSLFSQIKCKADRIKTRMNATANLDVDGSSDEFISDLERRVLTILGSTIVEGVNESDNKVGLHKDATEGLNESNTLNKNVGLHKDATEDSGAQSDNNPSDAEYIMCHNLEMTPPTSRLASLTSTPSSKGEQPHTTESSNIPHQSQTETTESGATNKRRLTEADPGGSSDAVVCDLDGRVIESLGSTMVEGITACVTAAKNICLRQDATEGRPTPTKYTAAKKGVQRLHTVIDMADVEEHAHFSKPRILPRKKKTEAVPRKKRKLRCRVSDEYVVVQKEMLVELRELNKTAREFLEIEKERLAMKKQEHQFLLQDRGFVTVQVVE